MRLFVVVAALVTACGIAAVPGCSKGGDAAEVPVGAAAGRVVELTGKVVATRGGATRSLAVGQDVFRDDVVATNDGAVTIELFHNQARWVVDADKTRRVDESAAWGLAKQERSSPSQHATSAAGRNGERTAADTAATAHTTEDLKPKNQAVDLEKAVDKQAVKQAKATTTGARGSGSASPPPTSSPELPRSPDVIDRPKPLPKNPAGSLETESETKLDRNRASLATLYERERAKLVACLDATTPKVTLRVKVVGGVPTVAVPPGVPLTIVSCLSQTVAAVRATGDGEATLELAR